jgi:hypothetical protein
MISQKNFRDMAMRATKKIARRLKDPNADSESKMIFGELINALDGHEKLEIARLFELNYSDFELALGLLVDWRLHQYIKPAGGLKQEIEETKTENNHWH